MKLTILLSAIIMVVTASCSNNKTENNMIENNALEVLKTRRAIRAYQDRMPEKELIAQIVEAGTYAPTGMGRQSPIIVAVTNREIRNRLSQLNASIMGNDSDPFYGAPVVLVVLADKQFPTYLYDGTLVMGNLQNAAHAVGLGSCWIHRAKEVFETPEGKALLKKWGIEGEYEGIGNCIIGYSAQEAPQPKPRKPDYVRYID
jgi:nitroreductase